MKKEILLSLTILLAPVLGWSAPESKPASSPTSQPSFSFKDVSSKVSRAFCIKMEQCSDSEQRMPMVLCTSQMNDAFMQSYSAIPEAKRPVVNFDKMSQCVKSIESSTCDTLKKASKLTGCEFIGQLS